MAYINQSISKREVIDVNMWLQIAQSLNTFLEDEQIKLFQLEKEVAEAKMLAIESGDTVSKAKVRLDASKCHLDARKQKARVERAIETIRIAKRQATLTNDVMHSN